MESTSELRSRLASLVEQVKSNPGITPAEQVTMTLVEAVARFAETLEQHEKRIRQLEKNAASGIAE